jgi:hypothetical protein
MTTIVSAFISNVNDRHDINLEKYFNCGINLLQVQIPKIIFVDSIMYNKIKEYENELTKIILIDKKNYYLYNYIDKITNFNVNNGNATKDTLEYMITICHKTEWIKEAIQINYFNNDNYIWIDFGIRHVFNCSDSEFIDKIDNIKSKKYYKIRIANIWDLNATFHGDHYTKILWYFAGGVFGGHKDNLLIFSEKMKDKCIQIIEDKNIIMWEVNIWYFIYMENKDLFVPYPCNHNESIITNY